MRRTGKQIPDINKDETITDDTSNDWLERVKHIYALRTKIEMEISKTTNRQSRVYNKNRKNNVVFEVGDFVFYPNNILSNAACNFTSKLAPRYRGPAVIIEKLSPIVVVIGDNQGMKIGKYHVNDLKPARQNLQSRKMM